MAKNSIAKVGLMATRAQVAAETRADSSVPTSQAEDDFIASCRGEARRIKFRTFGDSRLSNLLATACDLPSIYHDEGWKITTSEAGKKAALAGIHESVFGLVQTVRLLGLLMASDESGFIDEHFNELGFSVEGLSAMAEQLLHVKEEIEMSEPVGGAEAEAANG